MEWGKINRKEKKGIAARQIGKREAKREPSDQHQPITSVERRTPVVVVAKVPPVLFPAWLRLLGQKRSPILLPPSCNGLPRKRKENDEKRPFLFLRRVTSHLRKKRKEQR